MSVLRLGKSKKKQVEKRDEHEGLKNVSDACNHIDHCEHQISFLKLFL